MTGLRARKKQKTLEAIVACAAVRLRRDGFEATTMEDVARDAEVSVGTVYNYFPDKGALLLGVLSAATVDVAAASKALVDGAEDDGRAAVDRLLRFFVDALSGVGPSLLRAGMSLSFAVAPEARRAMMSVDETLIARLAELIVRLQKRGAIDPAIEAEAAALTLYAAFTGAMLVWMMTPGARKALLHRTLDRQIDVIFRGLAPTSSRRTTTRAGRARRKRP